MDRWIGWGEEVLHSDAGGRGVLYSVSDGVAVLNGQH